VATGQQGPPLLTGSIAENPKEKPMLQFIAPMPLPPPPSPLVLCDRLISLAQDADRAGLTATALHLMDLIDELFEGRRADA